MGGAKRGRRDAYVARHGNSKARRAGGNRRRKFLISAADALSELELDGSAGLWRCDRCPFEDKKCEGREPFRPFAFSSLEFTVCPAKSRDPANAAFWTSLYHEYKSGVLPYAGGLLDQPSAYALAMRLLKRIEADVCAHAAKAHSEKRAERADGF